jgi:plasmid stabilization system protein ParE
MALMVDWSKKAEKSFDDIVIYISSEFGEKATSNFATKVFNVIRLLKVFLRLGTLENAQLQIRGFVVSKQTTLFYQVRTKRIVLINFYDNRQNPKAKKY